jgi:3-deoxy-D-manno-octulosonate 8-phosphate phosphatase (KDO 8-P phosphatase)
MIPVPAIEVPSEVQTRAQGVQALILDVDGVLTDGKLHYGPVGEALKSFDVRDGFGLVRLRERGLPIGVLSGRHSDITAVRMRELGIVHVMQGARDKGAVLDALLATLGVTDDAFAYMGDDLIDLPVLHRARLAACPSDAEAAVQESVHWIVPREGGRGAVRALCDVLCAWSGHLRTVPVVTQELR